MRMKIEPLFGIITLFFLLTLLVIGLEYPFRAKLFPSIVLVFTSILVLLFTLEPIMPKRIRKYTEAGFDIMSADAFSKQEMERSPKPFFVTLLLLFCYFILMYFVGFLLSSIFSIYLFLSLNQYDSKKSLVYSVTSALIAFIAFGLILGVPLPTGVIFEWMGF